MSSRLIRRLVRYTFLCVATTLTVFAAGFFAPATAVDLGNLQGSFFALQEKVAPRLKKSTHPSTAANPIDTTLPKKSIDAANVVDTKKDEDPDNQKTINADSEKKNESAEVDEASRDAPKSGQRRKEDRCNQERRLR